MLLPPFPCKALLPLHEKRQLWNLAVPRQPVGAGEGALADAVAVVGADVVDAHPRREAVARPLGVLGVKELQLLGAGERVSCRGAGRRAARERFREN